MKDQKQTTPARETITGLLQDARKHAAQVPDRPKREKPLTQEERTAKINEIVFMFRALGLCAEDPAKDGEAK